MSVLWQMIHFIAQPFKVFYHDLTAAARQMADTRLWWSKQLAIEDIALYNTGRVVKKRTSANNTRLIRFEPV
jgi:hypothetical protein